MCGSFRAPTISPEPSTFGCSRGGSRSRPTSAGSAILTAGSCPLCPILLDVAQSTHMAISDFTRLQATPGRSGPLPIVLDLLVKIVNRLRQVAEHFRVVFLVEAAALHHEGQFLVADDHVAIRDGYSQMADVVHIIDIHTHH